MLASLDADTCEVLKDLKTRAEQCSVALQER